MGEYGPRGPEEEHCEAWSLFQSHSYSGAWQGKTSSGRLGEGTGPMKLSSSAQGMRSGGGGSSLSPTLRQKARREKAGNGCKGEGMFLPTTFVEDGPPFPAGFGQSLFQARSHISHLIP